MKITRIYCGDDGESYFEDIEPDFTMKEALGLFTRPVPAKAVFFREIKPGYRYTWHVVLCREYVVTLSGSAEVEVSSGEKRRFKKGDVLLVEDTGGKGHRTRCTSRTPWRQVFISLP
jgi:quercetin dioxygenase-like cupin family protein